MSHHITMHLLFDGIGVIGAAMIVIAYAMLQFRYLQSDAISYSLTNMLGASLILVSLVDSPNLPSIFIEAFWASISIAGIWRRLRKKSPE
jgi:hypothetical protein